MSQRRRRIPFAPRAEDFRYRSIAPNELPGLMRRHIATGAMGTIFGTLTTGMFLVAFGNMIGVSIMQWGILGAVSSFAITFQLLSAYGASRFGYRRFIWYVLDLINRTLRGAGLAMAYVLYHYGVLSAAASTLVVMLCLASFFAAASQPPWYSWLADIIPEKVHGSFMGRRDAWISLATLSIVIPASYCLDLASEDLKTPVLAMIFGVGILLGMIDLFMHRVIPEPPATPQQEGSFIQQVLAPIRDREYRSWLVFTTVWNFGMMTGASLATVFFVEDLRIRDNYLGGSIVLIGVPLIATMLTSKWSGALVDRLGVKRVLIVSHLMWAILPSFWIVASPRTALLWLGISSAIGGAGVSAAINASNKIITRVPPRGQRAMYIAVTACINNLAGGLAALFSGCFLAALDGRHWTIFGQEYIPFHLLFLASFTLRLSAWLLVFRIKTPRFDTGKK